MPTSVNKKSTKPNASVNGKGKSKSKGKSNTKSKGKSKGKSKTKKRAKKPLQKNNDKLEQIEEMWKKLFEPSDPVVNTEDNMETKKPKVVIVLIHADWCGHCQQLKPEWQQMKDNLNEKEMSNIQFEEVESGVLNDRLPEISNNYIDGKSIEYRGFPTIGSISNGRFNQYGGERNSKNLLEWVRTLSIGK